jgi:hypothetical protein
MRCPGPRAQSGDSRRLAGSDGFPLKQPRNGEAHDQRTRRRRARPPGSMTATGLSERCGGGGVFLDRHPFRPGTGIASVFRANGPASTRDAPNRTWERIIAPAYRSRCNRALPGLHPRSTVTTRLANSPPEAPTRAPLGPQGAGLAAAAHDGRWRRPSLQHRGWASRSPSIDAPPGLLEASLLTRYRCHLDQNQRPHDEGKRSGGRRR